MSDAVRARHKEREIGSCKNGDGNERQKKKKRGRVKLKKMRLDTIESYTRTIGACVDDRRSGRSCFNGGLL